MPGCTFFRSPGSVSGAAFALRASAAGIIARNSRRFLMRTIVAQGNESGSVGLEQGIVFREHRFAGPRSGLPTVRELMLEYLRRVIDPSGLCQRRNTSSSNNQKSVEPVTTAYAGQNIE